MKRFGIATAFVLAAITAAPSAQPVKIEDAKDRGILQAFLGHVDALPGRLSKEYCRKLAAEEPEGYCWKIVPQLRMALTAYRLTGEEKHLAMFAELFENMRSALTKGPDGYAGWYGKPLPIFRNAAEANHKTDVIITSFSVAHAVCDFLEAVSADEKLAKKYATRRRQWLELIEDHLVGKWEQRGCYVDLGDGGAVFRTPRGLAASKAHLTQPANKHSKICRAYLALHRVTGNDHYMRMAIRLGVRFKRTLTLRDGHYEWDYWAPAGAWDVDPANPTKWKHWIGVEHRGGYYSLSMQMALALHHHGVVFDETDVRRFLRTQTAMCWNGSMDKPVWARVDGTRHEKYMRGEYMCAALAPFDASVERFVYTGPRQEERLKNAGHPWHGGTVAAGWLEGKYGWLPKAAGGKPVYAEFGRRFLAAPANEAFHKKLAFEVKPPGYRAPRTPKQMNPMPPAPN